MQYIQLPVGFLLEWASARSVPSLMLLLGGALVMIGGFIFLWHVKSGKENEKVRLGAY